MSLFENNGADFSKCGQYRYKLWRIWDDTKPKAMFIGLNPSTANASYDDPTIRRIRSICANNGFGGFYMMNLYTYITPHPDQLINDRDENMNLERMRRVSKGCTDIVFAWGNFWMAVVRCDRVIRRFPEAKALYINKNGSPKHPLYCPSSSKLIAFNNISSIK